MFSFGKTSQQRKATCDKRLQEIVDEAIKLTDFTILCGHRTKEEQAQAFKDGTSKLQFPRSKHNAFPSRAIDVAPFPINWKNRERFYYLAGVIMTIAQAKGIRLRWGGDFNMDGDKTTNDKWDLPHFELLD